MTLFIAPNGNGRAPTVSAVEAHLEAIEDALLCGSIDAAAALDRLTARGKPVYRKTKIRLRNQRRQVVLFDNALDAVAALRKVFQVTPAAKPEATSSPALQMSLPLAANSNGGNCAAHRA